MVELPPGLRGVRVLYVLVNSTNTYERHRGTAIGAIDLFFDKDAFGVALVIGGNVREWCIGHRDTLFRTTDPALKEVRRLRAANPPHPEAVIDMLKVEVPVEYRSQALQRIRIADEGIRDHRLLISGMTCLVEI